jgi:tellurite methyltransferase
VLVSKPFIPPAPDAEPSAALWKSGDLLRMFADWFVEYSSEEVFDCMSSGVPHQHACNRVIARRPI